MDKIWVGQKKWKFHHSPHFSKSKSFPPLGLNNSNMFLFTLLLHKWDNPACHLTQSLMHTGLLSFSFFFAEKHWQAAGMKRFGVVRGGKKRCLWMLNLWQHLILLTGKVQLFFRKSEMFFKWKQPELQNKKVECFEQEKGAGWSAFIETAAFSSTHALSLLKMSEKRRWCSKQKASRHKA